MGEVKEACRLTFSAHSHFEALSVEGKEGGNLDLDEQFAAEKSSALNTQIYNIGTGSDGADRWDNCDSLDMSTLNSFALSA
jgi:hypothetical protein